MIPHKNIVCDEALKTQTQISLNPNQSELFEKLCDRLIFKDTDPAQKFSLQSLSAAKRIVILMQFLEEMTNDEI